jgi:hypothetical protein
VVIRNKTKDLNTKDTKEKKERFNAKKSNKKLTTTDTKDTTERKRFNAKDAKNAKKNQERLYPKKIRRTGMGAALRDQTPPWRVNGKWTSAHKMHPVRRTQ